VLDCRMQLDSLEIGGTEPERRTFVIELLRVTPGQMFLFQRVASPSLLTSPYPGKCIKCRSREGRLPNKPLLYCGEPCRFRSYVSVSVSRGRALPVRSSPEAGACPVALVLDPVPAPSVLKIFRQLNFFVMLGVGGMCCKV
jgi:hypothetical protein